MVRLPSHSSDDNKLPDRPFECSECRKEVKVIYSEIADGKMTRTSMCNECPELQKRLRGDQAPEHVFGQMARGAAGVACGDCGTTLESVQKGYLLGCSTCYEVFDHALIAEMLSSHRISPRAATTRKKSVPLHIGRAPGEAPEISPSLKLLALNEALDDTLKREDYEQAALLRDQIKALTEEANDRAKKEKK